MSDLARKLIAENKKSKATFLDLGNCGLSEIPNEVAELHWLEFLSLSGAWHEWHELGWSIRNSENSAGTNREVRDLTPLASLTSLKILAISETQVDDLSPLA